ncbi:hypothetical protein QMP26_37540 [Enterocloster clostridioformis]
MELEITYYLTSNDFSSCHMRDFHIVFVDISMEGDENGLSSARMFKKCGMKFPIVLFSDNDRHLMDSYEINALYLILYIQGIGEESLIVTSPDGRERLFGKADNMFFMASDKTGIVSIVFLRIITHPLFSDRIIMHRLQ